MSVIRFQGVSKTYSRKSSRQFFRSVILNRRSASHHEAFYALKNVDLDVKEGDSLAVIGANGAGKSTLLSLAAGLSWPDEGRLQVNGRVAALLELGSGFHPDLTGAENVLLNAALLGFSRSRAREKFDEIVEFSGIADFIDEPMRTYSAGMAMRLAFSVATNVDPDILLIDEVLAVGDEAFKNRCIEKIVGLKRAGRVLICASHVMGTLRDLCNRAVWLDHGHIVRQGDVDGVIQEYESSAATC